LQVRQLATGNQDHAATGILESSERRNSVRVDHAVMRERAIIVRGKGQKIQRLLPSVRLVAGITSIGQRFRCGKCYQDLEKSDRGDQYAKDDPDNWAITSALDQPGS
jgi:hypothetical protein